MALKSYKNKIPIRRAFVIFLDALFCILIKRPEAPWRKYNQETADQEVVGEIVWTKAKAKKPKKDIMSMPPASGGLMPQHQYLQSYRNDIDKWTFHDMRRD